MAAFSSACGRRKPVELDLLSFRSTGAGEAAAARRFGRGHAAPLEVRDSEGRREESLRPNERLPVPGTWP